MKIASPFRPLRRSPELVAGLAMVLALAACGSSSPETAGQPTGTEPATSEVAPAPAQATGGAGTIELPAPFEIVPWDPDSDNVAQVDGRLLLGEAPVAGARLRLGEYLLPPTDADGAFVALVDVSIPGRHVFTVADLAGATVSGAGIAEGDRAALEDAVGVLDVAYRLSELETETAANGDIVVRGRATLTDDSAAPTVKIYSYRLTGRVTDPEGRPVEGVVASARTIDRDYWTISDPTDADGFYVSLFTASDEQGNDPVPFSIRVAKGDDVFEGLPDETVLFARVQSAELDIELPPPGFALSIPAPRSTPGAVYQGLLVGVSIGGQPVVPVAATWPDEQGRFELTLPASAAGATATIWQALTQYFSQGEAVPGGAIDLASWPTALDPAWPSGLASIELP
jgi:hypothetical protein